MNPSSILVLCSRRILQVQSTDADDDAFNGIPETSLLPLAAAPTTRSTAPLDTSMALTVLVLLTALFFLALFSLYLRRLSTPPPTSNSTLDSSLPLVPYGGHQKIDDCPICLSDFTEGETVKLIPRCGHVFHPTCIDTWLASRMTCPLCRSPELFDRAEEV